MTTAFTAFAGGLFPFSLFARFFERTNRFVVLEVRVDHVRALRCHVKTSEKTVTIVQQARRDVSGNIDELFSAARNVYRRCRGFRRPLVLMCLDSRLATTIQSSVSLVHQKRYTPITQSELDGAIAQATWKLFDRHRARAAAKMGVPDLDVMLADASIDAITLDGHRVTNPVGFTARVIGVRCRQTFVSRAVAARLESFSPTLVSEAGFFETTTLVRATGTDPLLFADIGNGESSVFISDDGVVSHRATLGWGRGYLLEAFSEHLAVDRDVAEELLDRYFSGAMSSTMLKYVGMILTKAVSTFGSMLAKSVDSISVEGVYLASEDPLPDACFAPAFGKLFTPRARVHRADVGGAATELGFSTPNTFPLSSLAMLAGFYFSPSDGILNAVARRHARWLMG